MSGMREEDKRKFELTVDWLWKYKKGQSLKAFFEKNNYDRVIIYGMGLLGELLRDEISEYVTACLDQKGKNGAYGDVICIHDIDKSGIQINDSNLVVVTLMDLDRKIESQFYNLGFCGDILNLYDIVCFYS